MAMATSSAMKFSVLLLVLLSSVMAAHGHGQKVSCKNTCKDPIWLNGILVPVGKLVTLELKVKLEIDVVVIGKEGKKHSGTYKCPENVKALEFRYNKHSKYLEVYVVEVVIKLLDFLLGSVHPLIKCNLHY